MPDGLPMPRRAKAVAVQLTGIIISVLDNSITNVSMPTIAAAFGATPAEVVWVVNAYNLTLLATLLPLAALGERIGFRRVFAGGLVLFALASLACALSNSLEMLTAARVMQGVASAALMSMMGGLMRHIYPRRALGRGIGLNAMVVATAGALGPTASSAILSVADWPWLFAINVPIGLAAALAARNLPDSLRVNTRFDAISAMLSAAVLILIVLGLELMLEAPWRALSFIVVAAAFGVWLVARSSRQTNPMVPVDLFRIAPYSYAVAASMFLFGAQMASFVALPFYFQSVMGRSQVSLGLLMTAWPIAGGIMAPIAGRLADRYSAAILSGIGACVMVLGLAWILLLPADAGDAWIVAGMALGGVGFGFFQSPNNRAMLLSVPLSRSGAAGGIQATTRTFGQSLGISLVALGFTLSAGSGAAVAVLFGILLGVAALIINIVRARAEILTRQAGAVAAKENA